MVKMVHIDLREEEKSLNDKVHYAHEIHHRTSGKLFAETVKSFKSLDIAFQRFISVISGETQVTRRKSVHTFVYDTFSNIRQSLCENLQDTLRELKKIRPLYNAAFGYQETYFENLFEKSVVEIDFILKSVRQGEDGLVVNLSSQPFIANIKETIRLMSSTLSIMNGDVNDSNQDTENKWLGLTNRSKLIPDKNDHHPLYAGIEMLLRDLNDSIMTTPYNTSGRDWIKSTRSMLVSAWKRLTSFKENIHILPGLLNQIDSLSSKLDNETCDTQGHDSFWKGPDFNSEELSAPVMSDKTFFREMSHGYFNSTYTKLQLSDMVNELKFQDTIINSTKLYDMFETRVSDYLITMIEQLEDSISEAHNSVLDIIEQLQGFYRHEATLEQLARELKIWRKPELAQDSKEHFEFKYHNSFRIWPKTRSLQNLMKVRVLIFSELPICLIMSM